MTRLLLIISMLMLLSACATTKPYTEKGDFSADRPCLAIDGRQVCLERATPEQRAEHMAYVTEEPYLDEREKEALKLCKWAGFADNATTFIGLTACNAVELNPIFAGMTPTGILIVNGLFSWGMCEWFESQAEKSPRAYSTANRVWFYNTVRFTAAAWNATVLARCL